jgi:exopolysaccharide production protein ExoQ
MASTSDTTYGDTALLPGLIGFIFAFRTCLTVLWFQDEPQHATILSTVLSLLLLICVAFSVAGSKASTPASSFRTPPIRWLTVMLCLALISLSWSEAPFVAAAGYWTGWAADVAAVWLVLHYGDIRQRSEAIMKGFVVGAILVAIVAWSLPVADDLRLGNTDFLHPNAIGFLFVIAIFLAIHLARTTRSWSVAAFFLAITLVRTLSKTSIIAFLVAFSFLLLSDSTFARATKVKIGIAGSLVILSLWGVLETYLAAYTEGTGPETLTGRTIVWAVSLEYAIKKPWLGNGFYSYRFIVPSFGEYEAWQAHNELLQQFFSFGVVGLILVIALYWTFFRQIRRAPSSTIKTLAATLLVFSLVHGLDDTGNIDLSFPLWLMAMLSILLAASTPPKDSAISASTPALIE